MNFEGWSEEFDRAKSRVAESAASVADAARQFNSLDQMASQDEYIHTPDLNIPRDRSSSATPMPSSACSRILPRQLQTDMETETERRNTHVSGDTTTQVHSLPRKEENEEERINGGRPEADRFGHTPLHVPLLSVVSDVVHQSTRKTKEHTNVTAAANEANNVETRSSRQSARATKNPAPRNRVDHSRQLSNTQISYPSTDNSDSDDDADKDYDPIMDMVRQNKSSRRKDQQQTKQQSQIMELPIVRDAVTPTIPEPQQQQQQSFQGRSESSEAGISKKKMNPNRFMENLDQ